MLDNHTNETRVRPNRGLTASFTDKPTLDWTRHVTGTRFTSTFVASRKNHRNQDGCCADREQRPMKSDVSLWTRSYKA